MDAIPQSSTVAPRFRKLSVLMPIWNEVRTLRTIVGRVLNAPVDIAIELVAVDDGSTDGSRELLAEMAAADPRIRAVFHDRNQGKGAALRTAIREMTGDLALVQDADLEYNPADYPALLRPLLDGVADAVFGSRFLSGTHRRVLYFWHTVANKLLTLLCNILNDINLTDMETGYKVVRADILKAIPLRSNSFAIEPELTTKLAQWQLRLYEVPIAYEGRTYAEGKKIGLRDVFKALGAMLWYRFGARRFTTHEGFYLLQSLRTARRFHRWALRQVAPYLGRRILEAGCGIGNVSETLLDCERLICLDHDRFYVNRVQERFGHLANVAVCEADLRHLDTCDDLRHEDLDTVVCMNVLEHLDDDGRPLESFHRLLRPGGHVIVLVPAQPWLYSRMDRGLGHHRRYTREELQRKLHDAGFEVVHSQGFNRLGTLGWFVVGKLLRRRTLSPVLLRIYQWLLPLARVMEPLPVLPQLSLIAVGRKPVAVVERTTLPAAA